MPRKNVLIDTSIVLDGIHNVATIDKDANVFVTDIVLRELDGNKGADGSKGYNAREFFRQLNDHKFVTHSNMPITGKAIEKDDTLTEGEIDSGAHIFTLSRKWYRSKDINDTKIIEIAKDYDLSLKTLDQAQSVRAKSQGIDGEILKKEDSMTGKIIAFIFMTLISVALIAPHGFDISRFEWMNAVFMLPVWLIATYVIFSGKFSNSSDKDSSLKVGRDLMDDSVYGFTGVFK